MEVEEISTRVQVEETPSRVGQERRSSSLRRLSARAVPVVGTVGFFALLEVVVRAGTFPPHAFPTPSEVVVALYRLVHEGSYWHAIGDTLEGWGIGLGLAVAFAVPLGIVIGSSSSAYRSARFVIEFVRPIPSIALLPLFILIFGFTLSLKVYMAALAAFFPLLFQTVYGLRDIDSVARDTARAYRLGHILRFAFVELPGAAPYIATGLRISSSVALVVCVAVEVIVGTPGLGASVHKAQYAGDLSGMYALIATSGIVGLIITLGFNRLERVTLRWHPSQRETGGA